MKQGLNKNIIIYGCGGHARSIINILLKNKTSNRIILIDENAGENEIILGCKVLKDYIPDNNDSYIVGIGDNIKRRSIFEKLRIIYSTNLSVVAATAEVGEETNIGVGTFIASNVYIGPCCKIGNNSIINTKSVVEHESIIGNHTHIAVNATVCGRCVIGNNVLLGAGSTVIDKIKICDNVIIGAGSVVTSDINREGTYVGIPAKKID